MVNLRPSPGTTAVNVAIVLFFQKLLELCRGSRWFSWDPSSCTTQVLLLVLELNALLLRGVNLRPSPGTTVVVLGSQVAH